MFEPYNQVTIEIIEKYADPNDKEDSSHPTGHRNMLKKAVLSFYQAGHRRRAVPGRGSLSMALVTLRARALEAEHFAQSIEVIFTILNRRTGH